MCETHCTHSSSTVLDQYLNLTAPGPEGFYNFVQEHGAFLTAENVAAVNAAAVAKLEAKDAKAPSLAMKALMLETCVASGAEPFFEALQSDPPNTLCQTFQRDAQARMKEVQLAMSK